MADPRRVVIAAEDLYDWRPPERPWVERAVRVEFLEPGKNKLALLKREEKLLAISLTVPGQWHVTPAGERLRTVTVHGAFVGTVIPVGVDRLSLRFMPSEIRLGVLLGVIAVGVLIDGAFVPTRRHRRPQWPRRRSASQTLPFAVQS